MATLLPHHYLSSPCQYADDIPHCISQGPPEKQKQNEMHIEREKGRKICYKKMVPLTMETGKSKSTMGLKA